MDLDCRINGSPHYKYTDFKHPVGSTILKKQNSSMTVESMSYNMGRKIIL